MHGMRKICNCLFVVTAFGLPLRAEVIPDGVFGSHMVLQQGREIPVFGTTDSPKTAITVSFGDKKVKAQVRGKKWKAVLPAMPADAEGKELKVIQGDHSVTYEDVVVGEVWLASGQSNMLFRLNQSYGSAAAINAAENPNLRFYHSEPQVHTNAASYSAAEKQTLNKGEMYQGNWSVSSPATSPRMSAVGYYFGQELQKKLEVPVGIIHASLGGSQVTAWIPEAFMAKDSSYSSCMGKNWLESPIISGWVRGRAKCNIGNDKEMPHPYKPGYLYKTGIEKWTSFPVAGVIWYQGESDAELPDIAQNKKQIKDLIASWRAAFSSPKMPFIMVQLPRINAPKDPIRIYWPEFRHAQSLAASEMPMVYCVSTIDLGSTNSDVHPPRKQEVGNRLAHVAATEIYGKDVPCWGPSLKAAKTKGAEVTIRWNNAKGLKTTDGKSPVGFEVATAKGDFYPAEARIEGETVVLRSADVSRPARVRYAWKVFLEPNLVNDADLPAIPFTMDGKKNSSKK